MSIAFISSDFHIIDGKLSPGGCGYYRCVLPMLVSGQQSHAGQEAWDSMRGFGIKDTGSTAIFGFSHVMLKLMMLRWTPRQIELAQALGQRVYCDVDDFYQGLTPANKAYSDTDSVKNKVQNRDHYEKVIDAVDVLTVSTPFLLDHYSKRRDNVVMVRNGVNMNQFTPVRQNKKPVLGWTGATDYRNNDLEQLREWLPDFLEQHDLKFHHAGHTENAPSFADITGIDPRRLTTSPLVPIEMYPTGFKFDIGLIPLRDIPFNQAKSNIKGLEMVAAGIPFIASDLPEYRLLHEDGVGLLATTPDQWIAQAEALLPPHHRNREAARQRAAVNARWSIEARAPEWKSVFASTK